MQLYWMSRAASQIFIYCGWRRTQTVQSPFLVLNPANYLFCCHRNDVTNPIAVLDEYTIDLFQWVSNNRDSSQNNTIPHKTFVWQAIILAGDN